MLERSNNLHVGVLNIINKGKSNDAYNCGCRKVFVNDGLTQKIMCDILYVRVE